MAHELSISTLGPLVIELNGRDLTPHLSRKAQALLVYLAGQPRPVARELLTTLLWADSSGEQGMTNLRKMLSEVRRWLPDHLLAERQNVSLAPPFSLDVTELAHLLPTETQPEEEMERLATAVSLYHGPFLADLIMPDCPDLMLWITLQREQVRQKVVNTLHSLTGHCLRQRRYPEGVAYARQLAELEPLSETASRSLMLLLARSGQAALALAEYDRCHQQLQAELRVQPTAVTQSLHQRIQTAVADHATLPAPDTSFVGRETELTQINQHLADPAGRWLTITGPGGVGKTRLALQIAAEWAYDFLHGVHFVSLAATDAAATLAATIAAVVNAPLAGPEPPQQQLLNYLRQKEMLLLVDNGELLLTPDLEEAADLLPEILQHAPQVRLLVTSRERFNYQAEQVVALAGLPDDDAAGQQLFAERARQVQPDFAITPETLPAVRQICRLVEGLPLGIELAAASLASYSPTEIATGLAQTLDFLQREETNGQHDGRHRSLRAVFASTWQHLTADEQTTLVALSIFPGSFTAMAAQAIAEATPPLLLALVDKSMLRVLGERYQLHQLLRQFATEKVGKGPAVQARFAHYFAHFLQAQAGQLHGRQQQQALQAIDVEMDNLRTAWRWLVQNRHTAVLAQALSPWHHFYDMRGRFVEGEASFRLAVEQYQAGSDGAEDQAVLARLLARQGFFLERLGHLEAAAHQLQNGLTLLPEQDTTEVAFVLNHLGLVEYNQGRYEQAETFFRRSLELSRQAEVADQEATQAASTMLNLGAMLREQGHYLAAQRLVEESLVLLRRSGDARQLAIGLQVLGRIVETEGAYAAAHDCFRQSLIICQEIGDRMGQAIVCSSLCQIARQQQALPEARVWGEQALALFQEIGDPWGIAISSVRLGELALALADYAGGRRLFQTGLELCQEMGDQRGTAVCLCNLGLVALATDRRPQAATFFRQAITIAAAIQFMPLLLKALTGMAQLFSQTGEVRRAVLLADFIQQHPAADDATRAQATALWQKLAAQMSPKDEAVMATEQSDLNMILGMIKD